MIKNLLSKVFGASQGAATLPADHVVPKIEPVQSGNLTQSQDPLFGVKKGGKEVASKLFAAMSTDNGIHLESLLSALGALAGYACQMSVREVFVVQQGRPEKEVANSRMKCNL